jgi:hypothetical protein
MTGQQIGLLYIQLVASCAVMAVIALSLLQAREERHKYRLYAVRDKLLYLVASGHLSETSTVFKVFYRAMNTYAAEIDSLTIVSFFRASLAVKTELEKENQQRLSEAMRSASPEVQSVVDEFIRVVMDALRYNSPMLNLFLSTARHCGRFFKFLRSIKRFPVPVYDTYRYYETIHGKLGLVA